MLPAMLDESFCVTARGCSVAAQYVVVNLEMLNNDERRCMCGFDRARQRLLDQLPRAREFTELPLCMGQVSCCDSRAIAAKAKLSIMISFGVVYPQGRFEMRYRFDEIALGEARRAQDAASHRGLGHLRHLLSLAAGKF